MNPFIAGRQARMILGVSAALLVQGYSAYEVTADSVPRISEAGYVQPMTEPTIGGGAIIDEASLFPAGETTVQSYDGKGMPSKDTFSPGRRWRILLGLSASAVYDDNIFLSEDFEEEDYIFTITPLIGVAFGNKEGGNNFLSLVYTPTFAFFADHSDENAVEHAVDFLYRRQSGRLTTEMNAGFRALHGASSSNESDRGELVGERVDRNLYVAGVRFTYSLSDKTSIETGGAATYSDYDIFIDTFDAISRTFVDYAISGKTKIGIGGAIGYAEADGGPEQVYEQALARVTYNPTAKLTFSADGGVEFRQVDGGDSGENPVFGLGLTYQPFDSTTISLAGYRRVRPSSVVEDSNYTATGYTATVRQRFFGKVYLNVAGGYEHSEYESLHSDPFLARTDDYFFVRPSLEFSIHKATVAFFYEHRSNDSGLDGFEFDNNRVGVTVGLGF